MESDPTTHHLFCKLLIKNSLHEIGRALNLYLTMIHAYFIICLQSTKKENHE
jgi:hypothetical protein